MRYFIIPRFTTALAVVLSMTIALIGCSNTELKPASPEQQVSGLDHAARSRVNDVSILVQDAEWPGRASIRRELTPLRVAITNDGDNPLRIAYSEFALVGPNGVISTALPLYEIEGTLEEPMAINRYPAVTEPGFVHSNFAVAPYLRDVYPGLMPSAFPFYYDQYYYGNHITRWEKIALPTPAMRMNALPEGVLGSGGRMEGWLYFENIEEAERVVFRADLVNAESGRQMGEVRIPFEVK